MAKEFDFEISLSAKEYSSVSDIRGLEPDAHMLMMCAELEDQGTWLLRGSDEAFDSLLRDIDVEIEEGLAPKQNLPSLRRVRKNLTPEGDEAF